MMGRGAGSSYCAMPVPHMLRNRYMCPLMLRKAEILQVWWTVQCSSTSLAQCMRHALLDIFAPSCLDMHGEYILTHFDKHFTIFVI
jgi:hypothetical protein